MGNGVASREQKFLSEIIWEAEYKMKKICENFKYISLTGRLCYLFMCIEAYLVTCYPDRDWTPVAERCWQWTSIYWDEGADVYGQVVPEYLFEFDNYEETNQRAFDGTLSKKDYQTLVSLYADITNGDSEDEINQILRLPIDFANECESTNFCSADEPTLMIIYKMQQFLSLHNISFPNVCKISHLSMEQKNGWGDFMDSKYLSIII